MAKTIVFCADGTWNGPGGDDATSKGKPCTNVFKLFSNLDGVNTDADSRLADEQERALHDDAGELLQIAKYLHGVGDSDNFLVKILGGTMGAGIITRIVRGYTFVSRNYAPGDRIVLLGFSRGAYTARALAGLIAERGLLDASRINLTDKETAYRLGAAVWFDYRKERLAAEPFVLRLLEELAVDLPAFLSHTADPPRVTDVPIEAVAVWDTVGALGIPVYVEKDVRAEIFRFVDTRLSDKVRHGFHAIAADEQRDDFQPTFWDADPRIQQCLFPGAHADVGGGYPIAGGESGLSDAALDWISHRVGRLGVAFADKPGFPPEPNAAGAAHQPWASLPFSQMPKSARKFPADRGLGLSTSLLGRLKAGPVVGQPGQPPAVYAPTNLSAYLAGVNPAPGVPIYFNNPPNDPSPDAGPS